MQMSNDDPTKTLPGNPIDNKATQPSITAVFRLLQDIDKRFGGRFEGIETRLDTIETRLGTMETRLGTMETRLDAIETRLDAIEARIEKLETRVDQLELRMARDFAAVDARFVEMSNEMKNSFIQFGDKVADQMDHLRLHTEADYQDLLRRMRRLESQAS